MRKLVFLGLIVLGAIALAATALANGRNGGGNQFSAKLIGYEETPSESTPGHGSLRLRIDGDRILYRLHYEDFEVAEGETTQAHIHFGQRGVSGGVSAFLCGGAPPNSDKPACTPREGTFEGVIDREDVIGPGIQGIQAREMEELIRAIRKGYTYGNVHTTLNPAGLVRGQLHRGHRARD
jgi:CHRD domain